MSKKEENGQVMEQGVFFFFPSALKQKNLTKGNFVLAARSCSSFLTQVLYEGGNKAFDSS